MKNKIIICVLILICTILSANAHAKSPVWKVSKDGKHLFLGGTIHLLTTSDYPLPFAFNAAYHNSKILVLETDLQKFSAPEFQQKIIQNTMYSSGKKITQFLEADTLKALGNHLGNRGIPMEPLLQFKPGMLSITLTMIELQRLGLVGTGVDEFYSQKALDERRELEYLETVEEQIAFLSNMGEGNENELIKHTLDELKDLPRLFDLMKKAWKNGDNAQLQKIAIDPWIENFPKLYKTLLVDRNNHWIPKIEQMLKTKKIELVLFGALHFVGEDGILAQLEALGYEIENQ